MMRLLISAAAYLISNAVGLLIAMLILPGFTISPVAFVVAVAIFCIVQTLAGPLLTKISLRSMPQLRGSVALVTIFVGLWITSLIVDGMVIGGIANWLAATLLVWLGSLIATILLPIYVFKQLRDNRNSGPDIAI
ncbi:phage holin family protein [Pseudoruegeria sp. HB172150]|uniref:phage holin family protein n=1 Tax=Pseudoruegeria sp. HB172150 TaxID=2721164 RepID=UPI0015526C0B|nr:phage holin family protein [Pseudoruegeria sp. HB172150]